MIKTSGKLLFYVGLLIVVVSLSLAACSYTAPMRTYAGPERSAKETALIRGATSEINIESCDGMKVTSLDVSVLPGEHTIELSYRDQLGYSINSTPHKFDVEAGHTYVVDKKRRADRPGRYFVLITDKTTGKLVPSVSVITQDIAERNLASAEKSIKEHPHNGEFWGEKGDALFVLRRFDEALSAIEGALSFFPNSAYGWSMKGKTLYELKRYDEALTAVDKAIQLRPIEPEYMRVKETITKARGSNTSEEARN